MDGNLAVDKVFRNLEEQLEKRRQLHCRLVIAYFNELNVIPREVNWLNDIVIDKNRFGMDIHMHKLATLKYIDKIKLRLNIDSRYSCDSAIDDMPDKYPLYLLRRALKKTGYSLRSLNDTKYVIKYVGLL